MKKLLGFICCVVACTMLSITTTGCQKKGETKDKAKAADKADKAADKADKAADKADKAADKADKAADKHDKAADKADKGADKADKAADKADKAADKADKATEVPPPPPVEKGDKTDKKESSVLNTITPSHAFNRIVRESFVEPAVLARRETIS